MRIKKTSQYIEGGAGLPSYFTIEIDTGMKWIDGKPIYRKVINIGNLPNNGVKNVAINVSDIKEITKLYGVASGNDFTFPLPHASTVAEYSVTLQVLGSNLQIQAGYDRSAMSGYAILEYTKTTD